MQEFTTGLIPAGNYAEFDRVFDEAMTFVDSEGVRENCSVVAKELLTNCRGHTLNLDLTKPISLTIQVSQERLNLIVSDAGEGWREDGYYHNDNPAAAMLHLAETEAESGRGQLMCIMCCDTLAYFCRGRIRVATWYLDGKGGGTHVEVPEARAE